jgi:hydrogenase nickel incorporation protein HypA/HybF
MHEFSIAEALAGQVLPHVPAGARVREVEVRIGMLRGLEPEALTMSWQAVTLDTPLAGVTLVLDFVPWTITCGECGRVWTSAVPFVECACGNATPAPVGSDELNIVSMTVEEDEPE